MLSKSYMKSHRTPPIGWVLYLVILIDQPKLAFFGSARLPATVTVVVVVVTYLSLLVLLLSDTCPY